MIVANCPRCQAPRAPSATMPITAGLHTLVPAAGLSVRPHLVDTLTCSPADTAAYRRTTKAVSLIHAGAHF